MVKVLYNDVKTRLFANKGLLQNFSYITIQQIFLLLIPFITYPYLVRVLGMELYGIVITAQMLASYASLIVNFGSDAVCAKHVAINRNNKEKLAEIVDSVLIAKLFFCVICFLLYMGVVSLIPVYREYKLLFLLTYGLTLNDLLFPQFYFQGTENMKSITIISVLAKTIFLILVFVMVRSSEQYLLVPVLYTIGYAIGGFVSLYMIFFRQKVRFYIPSIETIKYYVKDCTPIFASDILVTIKDKVNYLLVGLNVGMGNVVVYDLALKLHSLLTKPLQILTVVLLPRFSVNRSVKKLKYTLVISVVLVTILVVITNIFLPSIVRFFVHKEIDLIPIRLFLVAPILATVSCIIHSNLFVAFGYNKYAFYSILITTIVYLVALFSLFIANSLGSIYSFVALALISYFVEFVYRLIIARRLFEKESSSVN